MNDDMKPKYRTLEDLAAAAGWDAATLERVRRDMEISAQLDAKEQADAAIAAAARR